MSQYITLHDPLVDLRESHRNVLTGSLSKIAPFRVSLTTNTASSHQLNSSAPNYLKQKVSLRVKQEELSALSQHHNSLHRNYRKLKHNLQMYARRSSLKLENVFQQPVLKYQKRQDLARLTHKSETADRTVFVDRKYNREFAISTAMASEATEIASGKARLRKMMSYNKESPLERQAKLRCASSQGQQRKEVNPVLMAKPGTGLCKKRKEQNFIFAVRGKK